MQLIEKYFDHLNPLQKQQFLQLGPLYEYWNERINVISRKDIENLYLHHVLHSLSLARIITFESETRIIDVGTGGGFPGIPLAILFPQVQFTLVDSIAKKTKVAETVIREIKLDNCHVKNVRIEEIHDVSDFVVARAVTEISKLFRWVKKNIAPGGFNGLPNGLLAYKGGELHEEVSSFADRIKIFELGNFFEEEFFQTKKIVFIPV